MKKDLSSKGLIKKTRTSEFDSIRKTGKIAIALGDDDRLISVAYTNGNDTVMVATNEGKCIRFSEKDVKPLGRDTMGVKAIELKSDDHVVDMLVYKEKWLYCFGNITIFYCLYCIRTAP